MVSYLQMRKERITTSEAQTMALGRNLGEVLKGGEIILFKSDLGGGKTTLIKGIAIGLGIDEPVSSPTFAIEHEYKSGRLELRHYDLYRLTEAGVLLNEISEVLSDESVKVIEWPELMSTSLSSYSPIVISIRRMRDGETYREIHIEYTSELAYIEKGFPD